MDKKHSALGKRRLRIVKRIVSVMVLVAIMAAVAVAMAVPAFAQPSFFACSVFNANGTPAFEINFGLTPEELQQYVPYSSPNHVDTTGHYYQCRPQANF